mmetsp:Transcript_5894/g.9171  ORF Transcript_5894/g.9171 Transcript_5894/m.9171 type:complete len:168 (+) Transcript_5894:2532-3035(+)
MKHDQDKTDAPPNDEEPDGGLDHVGEAMEDKQMERRHVAGKGAAGKLVDMLMILWDNREQVKGVIKNEVAGGWEVVKSTPWMYRLFQVTVASGTVAALAVSWIIVLVITESTLVILSAVIGIALVVCSALVPVLVICLVLLSLFSGFILLGGIAHKRASVLYKLAQH